MLNKYPDLDTIKNHPAHKNILCSNKLSKHITPESSILKLSLLQSTHATEVHSRKSKANTKYFPIKPNIPLPPIAKSPE